MDCLRETGNTFGHHKETQMTTEATQHEEKSKKTTTHYSQRNTNNVKTWALPQTAGGK
jgi:hypothetical protein